MRKILLLLSVVLVASCSKDTQVKTTVPDGDKSKKIDIGFKVSGFTQTTGPITVKEVSTKKTTATADPYTPYKDVFLNDKLIYVVYDSKGTEVSRLVQFQYSDPGKLYRIENNEKKLVSSSATFGTFSDQLPVGTYTVVAIVGQTDIGLSRIYEGQATIQEPKAYPALTLSDAFFYPSSDARTGDCFYYKGTLTVTSAPQTQQLILDRLIGQLTFNIEDNLPTDAAYFVYDVYEENANFKLSNAAPNGFINSTAHINTMVTIKADQLGKTNYQQTINIINTVKPMTAIISVLDRSLKIIATRTINNVTVNRNEQTTVSGRMFSNPTSSFNIALRQKWGTNPTNISFNQTTGKINLGGVDYPTAVIGSQIWTTLNYNGPGGIDYNNGPNNALFGKLYNMDDLAGLSLPAGWRIPTKADYLKLMATAGPISVGAVTNIQFITKEATDKLRTETDWAQTPGNNALKFSAVPGGYAYLDGRTWKFSEKKVDAHYLLSTDAPDVITNGVAEKRRYVGLIYQSTIYDEHGSFRGYSYIGQMSFYNPTTRLSVRFVRDN